LVATLNKPTVAEFEGRKPPTVAEFEQSPAVGADLDIQRIGIWRPTLKERVRNSIKGMAQRSPFVQPGKRLGQLGLHHLAESISGLGLYIPDVLASQITQEDTLASAVDKIIGFDPTPRDIGAGEFAKFMTSLQSVGRFTRPIVSKLPVREALRTILGGGVQFGARGTIEEVSKKIAIDKPINWKKIHAEAGWGTIFGTAETIIGKGIKLKQYRDFVKSRPEFKAFPRRLLMRMDEAMRASQAGMPKKQWIKIYGKDAQVFINKMSEVFPSKPAVKPLPAERPTTVPVKAPQPPAKAITAKKVAPITKKAELKPPVMATQAQKAKAHIIAKSKAFVSEKGKMRPEYRALAKAITGKRSIAKMTEQEAKDFIYALGRLPEPKMRAGKLVPPSIPRTTKLVPEGFFQRRFKRPTPFGLLTSNTYYAEKLGVKSLVEPLEKAKMRFDLEYRSAANELDKMGKKIDKIGKTTVRERLAALRKNIPTRAKMEMGDLLNKYEEPPAGLDPKKKEIFNWFRNLSRTMLAKQNQARAKLDMPLIKGRKAYMRHIATDISREMLAGKYPFPEGIGFWSGLNVGKKIFNPMEFQRKLEDDVYGLFTRDPVYASKAMMYNALKETHLNQPLKFFNEQLNALGKDLPEYKNLSPRERAELDKTMVMPADTRLC
jgi:hypothetical protein